MSFIRGGFYATCAAPSVLLDSFGGGIYEFVEILFCLYRGASKRTVLSSKKCLVANVCMAAACVCLADCVWQA